MLAFDFHWQVSACLKNGTFAIYRQHMSSLQRTIARALSAHGVLGHDGHINRRLSANCVAQLATSFACEAG
jgi:hypothetical protein